MFALNNTPKIGEVKILCTITIFFGLFSLLVTNCSKNKLLSYVFTTFQKCSMPNNTLICYSQYKKNIYGRACFPKFTHLLLSLKVNRTISHYKNQNTYAKDVYFVVRV